MSDKVILSGPRPRTTSRAVRARIKVTKRRQGLTIRPVIFAPTRSRFPAPPPRPARRLLFGHNGACEPSGQPPTLWLHNHSRRWLRRLGRAAEGQGTAIRCFPPAPGSLCSTRICAATRPPPARCASASRCRRQPQARECCVCGPTRRRSAIFASQRQSEDNRQFPSGLTLTAMDLPG